MRLAAPNTLSISVLAVLAAILSNTRFAFVTSVVMLAASLVPARGPVLISFGSPSISPGLTFCSASAQRASFSHLGSAAIVFFACWSLVALAGAGSASNCALVIPVPELRAHVLVLGRRQLLPDQLPQPLQSRVGSAALSAAAARGAPPTPGSENRSLMSEPPGSLRRCSTRPASPLDTAERGR